MKSIGNGNNEVNTKPALLCPTQACFSSRFAYRSDRNPFSQFPGQKKKRKKKNNPWHQLFLSHPASTLGSIFKSIYIQNSTILSICLPGPSHYLSPRLMQQGCQSVFSILTLATMQSIATLHSSQETLDNLCPFFHSAGQPLHWLPTSSETKSLCHSLQRYCVVCSCYFSTLPPSLCCSL